LRHISFRFCQMAVPVACRVLMVNGTVLMAFVQRCRALAAGFTFGAVAGCQLKPNLSRIKFKVSNSGRSYWGLLPVNRLF
jgi:hypothetical protein